MPASDFEEILSFWLGELDQSGRAGADAQERWWKKSDAFDAEIRERFGATHRAICEGNREEWLASARGRLAYVIVLDQLSRNMFRGTENMYAEDGRAQGAALEGLEVGCESELGYHERYFLYMPMMHAEDIALQDRCIELFESLIADFPRKAADVDGVINYAKQHRDIVARFGRFPHRNEIVGRESTEDELEFLRGPGSSF